MLYEPRLVAEELSRRLGMDGDYEGDSNSSKTKLDSEGDARKNMCLSALHRSGQNVRDELGKRITDEIKLSFRKEGIGWRLPIHMSMAILERLAKGNYPAEYYIMAVTGNTMDGFDSFFKEFGDTVVTEDWVEQMVEMPSLPWLWTKFAWVVGWPVHAWKEREWHVRVKVVVDGEVQDTVVMMEPPEYEKLLTAVGPLETARPMMGIPIGFTCEVVRSPTLYYAKTFWPWWDRGQTFGDWVYKPDGYDMGEWRNPQDEMIGVGYWGGLTVRMVQRDSQPQVFVYISNDKLMINMIGLGGGYGFLLGREELSYDLFSKTAAMLNHVKAIAASKPRRGVKTIMNAINSTDEALERILTKHAKGGQLSLWDAAWIVTGQGVGSEHRIKMRWARRAGEVMLIE